MICLIPRRGFVKVKDGRAVRVGTGSLEQSQCVQRFRSPLLFSVCGRGDGRDTAEEQDDEQQTEKLFFHRKHPSVFEYGTHNILFFAEYQCFFGGSRLQCER